MDTLNPNAPGPDNTAIPSTPKPTVPETEPEEFPFTASPGETGISPTNHLVNGTNEWQVESTQTAITRGRAANGETDATKGRANGGGPTTLPSTHLPSSVASTDASPSPHPESRQRNVQFSASQPVQTQNESSVEGRRESISHVEDSEAQPPGTPTREGYGARFISKLKTLSSPMTLASGQKEQQNQQEDSEREEHTMMEDADAEESAPELGENPSSIRSKVLRKLNGKDDQRRPNAVDYDSGPPSPHGFRLHIRRRSSDYPSGAIPNLPPTRTASENRSLPLSSSVAIPRAKFGTRNRTMSEIPESQRGAMSEDEGRDSVALRSREKGHRHRRTLSRVTSEFLNLDRFETAPTSDPNTPLKSTAQRIRHLNPFKGGHGKKKSVPAAKDARAVELINSLSAGIRPALMVAAAQQRDTHGYKRLPLLFELLKFKITDAIPGGGHHSKLDHRKLEFVIELSYGESNRRMTWKIKKSWGELAELHAALASSGRFRNLARGSGPPALPRFPKEVVPYLRRWRGLYEDEQEKPMIMSGGLMEEPADYTAGTASPTADETADEGISPMGRPSPKQRSSTLKMIQRGTSIFAAEHLSRPWRELRGSSSAQQQQQPDSRRKTELFAQNAQEPIEKYMRSLFQVILRGGDANRHNRLCRFLELSAIGIRLIPEMNFHGKEGYLWVKSIAGVSVKENISNFFRINNYPRRWFFVRSSYLACVEIPNSTEISDVFMFDSVFRVDTKETKKNQREKSDETEDFGELADDEDDLKENATTSMPDTSDRDLMRKGTHQLIVANSERILKVLSSKRTIKQFSDSIMTAMASSQWARPHRFKSYAPLRHNCWAIPLIDGEEYMWKVSTAIDRAKHTVFIHDWWLSPEIYLRRPAACSQEWRIDRLLKRKADQGVKIYIILYRNVESAFNLASERTKELLGLASPNIFIQRSPHSGEQKNFLYAHHEKVLVVDYLTAFCGGIDLCFGRWDNPEHRLADNGLTGFEPGDYPRNYEYCQIWPGKDYNNPRVHDFERVEWAYEETYDRTKVPRMPWHDIGMQLAGAPARDLCRHFIQRWNYLRRRPGGDGQHHEKPRPVLLPCPDFTERELRTMGLTGTCEVQILRSAGKWSLGLGSVERSVQSAYLTAIKESQHLVYIENQFFITSLKHRDVKNEIGDALVERAARAHKNGENWRAIIMIPLLPGFAFQPRDWGATSLRSIVDLQFWSICRDGKSIYEKLQAMGIRAEDYISFFSLRSWGEIDARGTLVTEQLYIHAKIMVVDDRIAIIGSANINDRSMVGWRDSEIAVIIQDRASVIGTMAGSPYKKGQFSYDLRMRLMAEHLGIDYTPGQLETTVERAAINNTTQFKSVSNRYTTFTNWDPLTPEPITEKPLPVPKSPTRNGTTEHLPPLPNTDDTDIGGPSSSSANGITDTNLLSLYPEFAKMHFPTPDSSDISDPLMPRFRVAWDTVASNNTGLFRRVFHCQPDSLVLTADQHADFNEAATLFAEHQHDTERPVMSVRRQQAWRTLSDASVEVPRILLRDEAQDVLKKVQGHLVEWPRDWMKLADWRKLADRIAPTAMFS